MLRGQERRQWKGTFDIHFEHQTNVLSLEDSADMNCGICRVLLEELDLDPSVLKNLRRQSEQATATVPPVSLACLRVVTSLDGQKKDEPYRLDFDLQFEEIKKRHTFLLNHVGEFCFAGIGANFLLTSMVQKDTASTSFRTPTSKKTDSGETLSLVLKWMKDCTCVSQKPEWYPSRLIDLSELKSKDSKKALTSSYYQGDDSRLKQVKVKLVEKADFGLENPFGGHSYATLSHRWGTTGHIHTVTTNSLDDFKKEITLEKLPLTFQHDIQFASLLHPVHYIWIDSLCILQDSREDWEKEAALMQRVYSESHLNNISHRS